jgi:hypothetical protein
VLTGQHSEQKAVPRDRKVSSIAITKIYLINMGGGNTVDLALTGQHSEQKAVPRDRKVTRPAITQMYLKRRFFTIVRLFIPIH